MTIENITEYLIGGRSRLDATALAWRGEDFSYGELFERTSRRASALAARGIQAGERILLLLNDAPATVETFLAALWIGAVPALLNPRLGPSRLEYILKDSQATLVVCEPARLSDVTASVAAARSMAQVLLREFASGSKSPPPFARTGPEQAAFWQYTSGTTGHPKAVMHHAAAMIRAAELYADGVLQIGSCDRIYSTAKLFFGYGLGNSLFFALHEGATAFLDDRWPTPELILENVEAFHPTMFFSVPALYHALFEQGSRFVRGIAPGATCISAGSQLPAPLFEKWRREFGIELLDGIGATETSHIFLSNRPSQPRAGSTGTPVAGYRTKLVDGDREITEAVGRGVLWVSGPSLALGYANRASETSERFVDGWFRTGDVFERSADGHYHYQGREDDLFKSNGRWVAPAEIEGHVLAVFGEVREAAVVPLSDPQGFDTPALCLVTSFELSDNEGLAALEQRLQASFEAKFESYTRPRHVRFLASFPKNENGKLLRSVLRATING